ncbi:hypothetical protein [Acidovorax sp.]|uniref:hypothetical protein n=1 Tax=Acidovorax sp. TaxID=1872122 RepID=UPI0025BCE447|nr:hypothetical protein [Acidovorax sp.]
MRRLTWWLQQLTSRLGWPAVAGGALILVSAVVHWGINPKELARQDDQRALSLVLTSTLKGRLNQPTAPDGMERLARFFEALPTSTAQQRMDVIAMMQSAALAEGLDPEEMSLQLSEATEQPFVTLDMVLPLNGSYLQLRRFVARALSENHALALEGVSFNRQSVSDATLEAQLRFSLYLKKP